APEQSAPGQTAAFWQPALCPESVRLSLPTRVAQYPARGMGTVHDAEWFFAPGWLLPLSTLRASPQHPGLAASATRAPLLPGAAGYCQCTLTTHADPLHDCTGTIRWLRPGYRQC